VKHAREAKIFESVPRPTLLATVSAMIGAVVWFAGTHIAMVSFDRHQAIPYSHWNHVISELGFPFASPMTWMYNGALAIAGLMVLPIVYAISSHLQTRLGTIAARFGYCACVALSCVGIYGLRQDIFRAPYVLTPFYRVHMAFATVFFLGWVVAVTLFAIVFSRHWQDPASRAMAIGGFLCALFYPAFAISAIYPGPMQRALAADVRDPVFRTVLISPTSGPLLTQWFDLHRPHIWWQAAFEWIWAWSILLWLAMALAYLWMKGLEAFKQRNVVKNNVM
jgi:hypothetical membrane protein